MDREKDSIEY